MKFIVTELVEETHLSLKVMRQNLEDIQPALRDIVELQDISVTFLMYTVLTLDEYEEVNNTDVCIRKRWDRLKIYTRIRLPRSYLVLVTSLEQRWPDISQRLHTQPIKGKTLQIEQKPTVMDISPQ